MSRCGRCGHRLVGGQASPSAPRPAPWASRASTSSVFGLSGEATLSLSLLRRAKDLVIGIPAILAWQWSELAAKKSLGRA